MDLSGEKLPDSAQPGRSCARTFQDALSHLNIADPRQHRRYRCSLIALLHAPGRPAIDRLVQVIDLSCGGAKLIVTQPIEPGQSVELNLYSEQFPDPLIFEVQYATVVEHADWLVGGQWVQPLSESHLQALVKSQGESLHLI